MISVIPLAGKDLRWREAKAFNFGSFLPPTSAVGLLTFGIGVGVCVLGLALENSDNISDLYVP